jgi:ABC-type transport system involved in multi-copper enzyme maturation permease subunit
MFSQTIALIRYQLLGQVNARLWLVLLCFAVLGALAGQFIAQLSLVNSEQIALAATADLMRYCAVLLMLITVSYQVAQDYELQFFDRLFAMPVKRFQYVLAQFFLVVVMAVLLVLPIVLVMSFSNAPATLYWAISVVLELVLVGQIATLIAVSLEKLTIALMSSFAFYLFAKGLPLVQLALSESASFYQEESSFQFYQLFFSGLEMIMPTMEAFAQNNLLFDLTDSGLALLRQAIAVLVYSLFVQAVVLIDFYRKELNGR